MRQNLVAAVIVTLIIGGGATIFLVPWGVGVEPVRETVTIPAGSDESWDVDTRGYPVHYHVEVISDGRVDVTAAKFAYQDGEVGYFYLPGHKHTGVRDVEGTVGSYEDLDSFDLFVENDNGPGPVTVNVEIEHTSIIPIWLLAIVIVAVFVTTFWLGTREDEMKDEEREAMRQDRESLYRAIDSGEGAVPADTYCLDCGAQQYLDEVSRRAWCPRCGRWD